MTYPHITINTRGVLCIDETRHRVIDIVADHVVHGYNAAQIVEQYPESDPRASPRGPHLLLRSSG